MGCGVGCGAGCGAGPIVTGMVSVLMAAPTISSSICSADKSVSSVSADWSLLNSITADIIFLITSFSKSVCKYFFISSVAEWWSIIYSISSSTLCADITAIHDEDARSISIARIIYEKNVCNVIFLE